MIKLLTPFFVVFFVAGCASADLLREAETPEQKYWAALQIFDVYDEAALHLVQDPNTPVTIKQGLKRARNVAKQALILADEAYNIMQAARMTLEQITDETNLDKFNAALQAFNSRSEQAFIKVDSFARSVDDFQE